MGFMDTGQTREAIEHLKAFVLRGLGYDASRDGNGARRVGAAIPPRAGTLSMCAHARLLQVV